MKPSTGHWEYSCEVNKITLESEIPEVKESMWMNSLKTRPGAFCDRNCLGPWELSRANVCWEPEFVGAHWKSGVMGAGRCQGGLRTWVHRSLPGAWSHMSCLGPLGSCRGSLEPTSTGDLGAWVYRTLQGPLQGCRSWTGTGVGWLQGLWWSQALTSLYFSHKKGISFCNGLPRIGRQE